MKGWLWIALIVAVALGLLLALPRLLGPQLPPSPPLGPGPEGGEALGAIAEIVDAEGETVGVALLVEVPEGVLLTLKVEGLPPGEHGLHLHERGACEPPDFTGAGGHFNPFGKAHGLLNPEGPHAGDLPNLIVRPDGTAEMETIASLVTLQPGRPHSLLDEDGAALVIHEKPDDHRTDPSGASGARIACGAIRPL